MKLALNIGTLALVGLFSVSTLAQVAVKPRPVEPVRPEVIVKPSPSVKGQGLEAKFDQAKPATAPKGAAKTAAAQKEASGASCNAGEFASALSSGTRVSFADAKAVVDSGLVSQGTCGQTGGVASFGVNARENLLESEVCTLNKGGDKMSASQRDEVRAGCMAEAKNNDGNGSVTTAQAEKATIAALRDNCNIIK